MPGFNQAPYAGFARVIFFLALPVAGISDTCAGRPPQCTRGAAQGMCGACAGHALLLRDLLDLLQVVLELLVDTFHAWDVLREGAHRPSVTPHARLRKGLEGPVLGEKLPARSPVWYVLAHGGSNWVKTGYKCVENARLNTPKCCGIILRKSNFQPPLDPFLTPHCPSGANYTLGGSNWVQPR